MERDVITVNKPLFKLGQVLATPGAIEALEQSGQNVWELISLHMQGQWGQLSDEDRFLNDQAVQDGSRILSAYILNDGKTKLWCLTEATDDHGNRAATTLLLPSEY